MRFVLPLKIKNKNIFKKVSIFIHCVSLDTSKTNKQANKQADKQIKQSTGDGKTDGEFSRKYNFGIIISSNVVYLREVNQEPISWAVATQRINCTKLIIFKT